MFIEGYVAHLTSVYFAMFQQQITTMVSEVSLASSIFWPQELLRVFISLFMLTLYFKA